MKNIMRFLFLIVFSALCTNVNGQGQNRKVVHFLVDTLNTPQNSRLIEIGIEGGISYYSFLCKCVPPYQMYPTFTYNKKKWLDPVDEAPVGTYVSWIEFSKLLKTHGNHFQNEYKLIIVERLPDRRYKVVNELYWVPQEPIVKVQ